MLPRDQIVPRHRPSLRLATNHLRNPRLQSLPPPIIRLLTLGSEIRHGGLNPKYEARNSKQILNPKFRRCETGSSRRFVFQTFFIRACFGFRASSFVLYCSNRLTIAVVVKSWAGVEGGTGVAGRFRPARGSRNIRTAMYHNVRLTESMTTNIQNELRTN